MTEMISKDEALRTDEISKYDLVKCMRGECSGCDREHYASCGDLMEELREREQTKCISC